MEMHMFRFFEFVGVITTAVFISMAVAFLAQDRGIDVSFIEAAIAQEDANFNPPYNGGTKVHPDELECMSRNIYFEANNQSKAGQIAVARVVMNRVQDIRYPNTVCEVIQEGPVVESWKTRQQEDLPDEERIYYPRRDRCQFSWYCDGKADEIVSKENNHAWRTAQDIAFNVMVFNKYSGLVEGATHYHADYVDPSWNKTITLVTKIDDHIFYRWD
jgi:spore germination cell wall hydrolase CwlJ-like protein